MPHDLELLLVQRIADEVALHGERILHEAGGVEGADGFVIATPGAITLRPPDQPAMKCGSTRPVAMRRSASTKRRSSLTGVPRVARAAEVDMHRFVAREMVLDPNVVQHPGIANQLGEFLAVVRAMQAGRDQHRDGTERDAGGTPWSRTIGRRNSRFGTGRVMSQMRMQALFRPRASSASAGRGDRPGERGGDGALRVRQFRHRTLADDRWTDAGRDRDRQMASPNSRSIRDSVIAWARRQRVTHRLRQCPQAIMTHRGLRCCLTGQ